MWNIQKWNKRTLEYAGAIFYSDSSMWSVTLQTSRETWERGRLRTKAECDRHAVLTGTTVNITSLTQLHTFHRECLCGTARTWNKAQARGRIWNRWLNLTSITTDSQYIYIYRRIHHRLINGMYIGFVDLTSAECSVQLCRAMRCRHEPHMSGTGVDVFLLQ